MSVESSKKVNVMTRLGVGNPQVDIRAGLIETAPKSVDKS